MKLLNYLLEVIKTKSKAAEYSRNKKTSSLEETIRLLKENEIALKNSKPPSSTSWSTLKRFNLDYTLSAYPHGNKQWREEDQEKWFKKRDEAVEELNALIAKLEEKNEYEKYMTKNKKETKNEKQINKSKNYDLRLKNISEFLNNALRKDPNNEELKKLQENINTAKDMRNIDKKFYKNLVDAIQNQVPAQNNNKHIGNHIIINNNNLNYDYNVVADAYERLVELHANYSAFLTSKLDDKNINKDDVRKYYVHIKDLNKKIADWTNEIYGNNSVVYDENTYVIAVNISPAQFLYVIDEINKETNDSLIELKTKDASKEPWKTSFNSTLAEFKEDAKNQLQTQKNEINNIINITIESSEQSINNAQFNNKKALEDELKKIKEEKEKLKPEASFDDLNKISAELTILHNKIYFANQEFENKRIAAEAVLKSFPQGTKFKIVDQEYEKDELIQKVNENKLPETSLNEIINKYENEIQPINENKNLKKQMSDFMEEENKAINLISNNKDLFSQDIIKQAEEVKKSNKKWQPRLNVVPHITQLFFDDWKNSPALSGEQGFKKIDANTHDFTLETIEQKVKNLETLLETLTDSINLIRNFSSKDNAEKIKTTSSGFVDNISTLPKIEDFLNQQIQPTNTENNQINKTVFETFKEDLKTKSENFKQILSLFSDKFQNEINSINSLIEQINECNNDEKFDQLKKSIESLSYELQNLIKNPLDHDNIKTVIDMLNAIRAIDPSIIEKIGLPESVADIDRWTQKSKEILTVELKKLVYLIYKKRAAQTSIVASEEPETRQNSTEVTDDASMENMSGTELESTQTNNDVNTESRPRQNSTDENTSDIEQSTAQENTETRTRQNSTKEIKEILRNSNPNEAEINSLITYLQNNNNPPDLSDPNIEVSQKDKNKIMKRIDKKINALKSLLKIEMTEYEKASKRGDDGLADKDKHFNNIKIILNTLKKLENMRSNINASDVYTKGVYLQDKIRRQELQEPFTKKIGPWGNKIFYMKETNEQEH